MGFKGEELPAELKELRRRFERWRRGGKKRKRIPDRLWAAAAEVAGRCGTHRTARTLRLNYYALKKRVEGQACAVAAAAAVAAPSALPVPAFVEWLPLAAGGCAAANAGGSGPYECTLELGDGHGATMRVHLRGLAAPDLAALSRSFWNPGR